MHEDYEDYIAHYVIFFKMYIYCHRHNTVVQVLYTFVVQNQPILQTSAKLYIKYKN